MVHEGGLSIVEVLLLVAEQIVHFVVAFGRLERSHAHLSRNVVLFALLGRLVQTRSKACFFWRGLFRLTLLEGVLELL